MNAHQKKIVDAYDKMGLVQTKFAKVGACDSEVNWEVQQIMYDALKGREWKPRSVDGWQLYSSMPSSETRQAVAQLNTAGKRLHKVLSSAPVSELEWIKSYYGIDL